MMQKFGAACAYLMAGSYATDAEMNTPSWNDIQGGNYNGAHAGGNYSAGANYGGHSSGYGGQVSYGGASYGGASHGFGGHGHSGHGVVSRKVAPVARSGYSAGPTGYAPRASRPVKPQGFRWGRRSTYRPNYVKAFNVDLIDEYWRTASKPKETIVATCEFDFVGYSESKGTLTLRQEPDDLVSIIGTFEGIGPGLHGLKVHEWGDLEYGCKSVGDVFNPFGGAHGHSHMDMMDRRAGDCENIQGRWDTDAEYKNRDAMLMLSGPNSVIGRSMVVYQNGDDVGMTEHPGIPGREERKRKGLGEPIACCVIGLAKGEKPKATAIKPEPLKQAPAQKLRAKPVNKQHSHGAPAHAVAPQVRAAAPRGYGYGIQQRQFVQPRW